MKKLFITVIGFLILSGCSTPYQEYKWYNNIAFVPNAGGGFTDTKIQEGMYRVTFKGNANTSPERVADLGLLRDAEITLRDGYRYFIIADESSHIATSLDSTANLDGSLSSVGTTNRASTTYQIKCFKERPAGSSVVVYDAEEVARNIGPKYGAKIVTPSTGGSLSSSGTGA